MTDERRTRETQDRERLEVVKAAQDHLDEVATVVEEMERDLEGLKHTLSEAQDCLWRLTEEGENAD